MTEGTMTRPPSSSIYLLLLFLRTNTIKHTDRPVRQYDTTRRQRSVVVVRGGGHRPAAAKKDFSERGAAVVVNGSKGLWWGREEKDPIYCRFHPIRRSNRPTETRVWNNPERGEEADDRASLAYRENTENLFGKNETAVLDLLCCSIWFCCCCCTCRD